MIDELFYTARASGKNNLVLKQIQEALSHSLHKLSDIVQYLVDNSEINIESSQFGVRVSDGENSCTLYGDRGRIWIFSDMNEIEIVYDAYEDEDYDDEEEFDFDK